MQGQVLDEVARKYLYTNYNLYKYSQPNHEPLAEHPLLLLT